VIALFAGRNAKGPRLDGPTRENVQLPILTPDEHALLVEAVDRFQPELHPLVDELVRGERRLTAEEGDSLSAAVGDELATTGFDLEYEPTDRGRALEALIDKLARVTALFY